ncbi:hypothetical protein KI387_020469, partial [Taxus chinensis]
RERSIFGGAGRGSATGSLAVLDALSYDEEDTLQRASILCILRVPHVAPSSHILCDLFSYWDADRNTFQLPGVRDEWTITLDD